MESPQPLSTKWDTLGPLAFATFAELGFLLNFLWKNHDMETWTMLKQSLVFVGWWTSWGLAIMAGYFWLGPSILQDPLREE